MLVGRAKESPYLGLYSQEIEIVASDFIARNVPQAIRPAQLGVGICVNRCHSAEGVIALSKVLKCGIRTSQQPSHHPLSVTKLIKSAWLAYSEWLQQDGI